MIHLCLCLLVFISLIAPSVAKEVQSFFHPMKLERVIDGDTIVASGQKIRLWGIDAPEKGHPLYRVATLYLQTILAEGGLSCKFIDMDRYRRSVMQCSVNDADIGAMMVQMGMAKDFIKYSSGYYSNEQNEAQRYGRGLWRK